MRVYSLPTTGESPSLIKFNVLDKINIFVFNQGAENSSLEWSPDRLMGYLLDSLYFAQWLVGQNFPVADHPLLSYPLYTLATLSAALNLVTLLCLFLAVTLYMMIRGSQGPQCDGPSPPPVPVTPPPPYTE